VLGIDVDASVPLDVQHPFGVQHIERVVVAEGNGSRTLSQGHRVVQKLELNALSLRRTHVKKHIGDPRGTPPRRAPACRSTAL